MQYFSMIAAMITLPLIQPASSRRVVMEKPLTAPTSQLSFSITETLCGNPDLVSLKGVFIDNAKAANAIVSEGLRLANELNCRLCDITGEQGENNNIRITCSAQRVDIESEKFLETCHTINGRPGWRTGAEICLPCPDECEQCATGFSGGKFKCVLPNKTGAPSVPAPWTCKPVQTKAKPPSRFQWCQDRSNLLSTATLNPSKSSKLNLLFAAVPCSSTPKSSGIVADIMGIAGPSLAKAYQQNCALCSLSATGPISSEYSEEFQSYKYVIGQEISAEGACAFDTIGQLACRNDQGATGWNKNRKCHPCPLECYSCADSSWFSKKGFTCKMYPPTPLEAQFNQTFTNGMSNVDEVSLLKLPNGYECEEPKRRACKGGLCGTYKVWCKYKEWSN